MGQAQDGETHHHPSPIAQQPLHIGLRSWRTRGPTRPQVDSFADPIADAATQPQGAINKTKG